MTKLQYIGKNEPISDTASYTYNEHKYIEIIPQRKASFDIFSFIDFFDSLTPDYICSKLKSKQNNITIEARHKQLPENAKSFKIKIVNQFSEYIVSVRDGLIYMHPTKIN